MIKKGDIFICIWMTLYTRLNEIEKETSGTFPFRRKKIFEKYGCIEYETIGIIVTDPDLFFNVVILANDILTKFEIRNENL